MPNWAEGTIKVRGTKNQIIDYLKNVFEGSDFWGNDMKIEITSDDNSIGLFDKNEQEVFVGDIIKCTRGCPHEVYLEKEYGGTYIGGMPAVYLKGIKEGYAWTGDEEIIGNIYENPELLKEKE